MAVQNSTPKNPRVPYVDHVRDHRDMVIHTAIRKAIDIIAHDDNDAADLLHLALWKLEASWPVTEEKFTTDEYGAAAGVTHG